MDESSLSDMVIEAISAYYANTGRPGIVTSFVLVAEAVREDGSVSAAVAYPDDQALSRSLGLIGYGEEWIRDDVRNSFMLAGLEDGEGE